MSGGASRAGGGTLAAILCAAAFEGTMLGITMPLVPLALEARGASATLIGLNTAAGGLGVLAMGPLLPWLVSRLGTAASMMLGAVLSALFMVCFTLTDHLAAWFVLRFLLGMGIAIPWIVSEAWINIVAGERMRGRLIGVYSTLLAAGIATGPVLLNLVGTAGSRPFLVSAGLALLIALPLLFVRGRAPAPPAHGGLSLGLLRRAPVPLAAAFIAGFGEAAIFSLLSIYGVRGGLPEGTAVLWLSGFVAGNLLLQIPLGWLADHVNRLRLLTGVTLACGVLAAALPLVTLQPVLLWPLLFAWGGLVFGVYTISLAVIGQRFGPSDITAANTTFAMLYTAGSLAGPTLAGSAMDAVGRDGLAMVLVAAFFALAPVTLLAGRRRAPDG